jgi:1,4-alpha-glucan branching enzyme
MGSEFAQGREWNFNGGLEWHLLEYECHKGVQTLVGDLNRLYREKPALHHYDFSEAGFEWIDCIASDFSILSYLRKGDDDAVVVVLNFTPVPHHKYRIGVPEAGDYAELLNSDSSYYDGSDVGNKGHISTTPEPSNGHAQSLLLTLPPLGGVILQRQ